MPGIFGFISSEPVEDGEALLRRMGSALCTGRTTRSSCTVGRNWGIGSSWIPGLQEDPEPWKDPAGGKWIVAAGEIYPGDPESPPLPPRQILLRALDREGPGGLSGLDGQYAAALYDPERGKITVLTDRHGLHLVYFAFFRGTFFFASEMKAISVLPGAPRSLDPGGLAAFLLLGEHFDASTLLEGIEAGPSAAWIESSGGPPAAGSWWKMKFTSELEGTDPGEAAREAGRLFKQAVRRQAAGEAALGIPLSGGLDSRICLAALPGKKAGVSTFTWGDPGCLDRKIASRLSALFGTKHFDYDYRYESLARLGPMGVWWSDGQAGCADYHFLPYLDDLAEHCRVVLNGFAGDVVLGGNFHKRPILGLPVSRAARVLFRLKNGGVPAGEAGEVILGEAGKEARELEERYAGRIREFYDGDLLAAVDSFLLETRVRRWTSFGTQMLRTRVVSRAPFYDRDFFSFLLKIPPSWRTRHKFYRKVLLLHFKEAASLPWETTGFPASWPPGIFRPAGRLARSAMDRLERFTRGRIRSPYPVARISAAYRGVLAPLFQETILDPGSPVRGIVRPAFIDRIWKETSAGSDRWANTLGLLLALHWFHDLFLGTPPKPTLEEKDVEVERAGPERERDRG